MLLDDCDHSFADLDRDGMGIDGQSGLRLPSLVWTILPLRKASETRCSGEYAMRSPTTSSSSEVAPVNGRSGRPPRRRWDRGRGPTRPSQRTEIGEQLPLRDQQLQPVMVALGESVCSEMISDIDGMPQMYGSVQLHSDGQPRWVGALDVAAYSH